MRSIGRSGGRNDSVKAATLFLAQQRASVHPDVPRSVLTLIGDLLEEYDRMAEISGAMIEVLWMAEKWAEGKRRDQELFDDTVARLRANGVKWK